MNSIENNADDWREIRARVDSIANAVFLIAGGALSLSLSVMLSNKGAGIITPVVQSIAACAWWALTVSIVLSVLLKAFLIFHAFMLQVATEWLNRNVARLNTLAWLLGIAIVGTFTLGLVQMVRAAVLAVGA